MVSKVVLDTDVLYDILLYCRHNSPSSRGCLLAHVESEALHVTEFIPRGTSLDDQAFKGNACLVF